MSDDFVGGFSIRGNRVALGVSGAPRLRPELISIATIASVWSITSAPPDFKRHLSGVDHLDLAFGAERVEEWNGP